METGSKLDVRTVVAVVSVVALVAFVLWNFGFGLAATQSLQNQLDSVTAERNALQAEVTSLQNQIASLDTQVTWQQEQIQALETQLELYVDYIVEHLYIFAQPQY